MKRYRLILSALLIAIVIILLLLHSCQTDTPAVSPTGNNDSLSTDTTATSEAVISTSEGPANYVSSESETTTVSEAARESTEPITEETTGPETTESKPTEPKPTEPKPTEPEPTEPKPTVPAPDPSTTCSSWEDHVWSDWIQRKAPTSCSADGCGEDVIICTKCGYVAQTANPTLPHSWGGWTQAQAPTCGAAGTETRICSRCGQTETRTVAAIGNHSWTETAPTCTEAGAKTCTVCGKKETIGALGHDWVHHDEEGHWRDVLTCRCGAVFYTYDEWYAHARASYDDDYLNAHSGYSGYVEWVVDRPAYDSCSRCGMTK